MTNSHQLTKAVVTTTISPVSEAMRRYAQMPGWRLVIAGDKKTPHKEYEEFAASQRNIVYLHPDQQHEMHPELSDAIGWNCIQRRYAAVMFAMKTNTEIFGFADDDNIPYTGWGDDVELFGAGREVDIYNDEGLGVFDPYSATNHPELWHRGYPIDWARKRKAQYCGRKLVWPVVIERMVDGDPDIDAIYRLPFRPNVKFDQQSFSSDQLTVFNSQNTLVLRKMIPYYLNLPGVGRHDDIIGSIIAQRCYPEKGPHVLFECATVFQERRPQDLVTNLEKELYGYRYTYDIVCKPINELARILPPQTVKAFKLWNEFFGVKTDL